ncbi:MAG: YHS domain-containing protein [Acidobacteria bacterium]|nr:YHS domain-containing protein [Acidobacteriota bacterium]
MPVCASCRRKWRQTRSANWASSRSCRLANLRPLTKRRKHMHKDPVCGMEVDPATAAGRSEHRGQTYYFCSKSCQTKFEADPSQYTK